MRATTRFTAIKDPIGIGSQVGVTISWAVQAMSPILAGDGLLAPSSSCKEDIEIDVLQAPIKLKSLTVLLYATIWNRIHWH